MPGCSSPSRLPDPDSRDPPAGGMTPPPRRPPPRTTDHQWSGNRPILSQFSIAREFRKLVSSSNKVADDTQCLASVPPRVIHQTLSNHKGTRISLFPLTRPPLSSHFPFMEWNVTRGELNHEYSIKRSSNTKLTHVEHLPPRPGPVPGRATDDRCGFQL
ncbi:hypothetical protein H6P81_011737 [Aristolochia fimbriata]|uniref:Uncharacterized protein n=1 Tax=Aristolochia fimbriata TaxID=158543 RepID=A0AAV7EA84_ARIFI|nr:hypothetical protein H6P81_011737 [Aristolochia fimbriata]